MKKFLSLILLAGTTGALLAQQPAGAQPRDTQPIVVAADGDTGPQTTATVKTITTRKAYTQTTSVPESVTTVTAPDRVLVREGMLAWLSVGIRSSLDYHITPKEGSLSCLWIYGEWYNTVWGIQGGVGYLWMPLTSYTDGANVTYNGTGSRGYIDLDLIGKYYWWFARAWWIGAGVNYAALLGGQIKWSATGAPAATTNPADSVGATGTLVYPRWADVAPGGGLFYIQVGTGLRIALGNTFNVVNFEPDIRLLIPINGTQPYGTYGLILRANLGFSYSFNM